MPEFMGPAYSGDPMIDLVTEFWARVEARAQQRQNGDTPVPGRVRFESLMGELTPQLHPVPGYRVTLDNPHDPDDDSAPTTVRVSYRPIESTDATTRGQFLCSRYKGGSYTFIFLDEPDIQSFGHYHLAHMLAHIAARANQRACRFISEADIYRDVPAACQAALGEYVKVRILELMLTPPSPTTTPDP